MDESGSAVSTSHFLIYGLAYMASDNEYMRAYMLRRYNRRMQEARSKLGNRCVRCGATKDLQLDHKDRETKSFTIGRMWSVSEQRFEMELSKCQLLCRTCHEEKTLLDKGQVSGKVTHGTLSSYRYCKCDACKLAKSNYNKLPRVKNRKNELRRLKKLSMRSFPSGNGISLLS